MDMNKGPIKIDERTFHCSECNYNVQVYGERYFDYGFRIYVDTYVCLNCKSLFEGVSTELQDFSNEKRKAFIDYVDVNSIECIFCGSYNNIKWNLSIGQCPKCGSTMTFETQGEISLKPLDVKKVIEEKPIKVKEKKSVEEVYKNGLITINDIDMDNNLYPITHKCYPEQIRQPMTDEELHVFGVELVLVYHHHQNSNIIKRNVNPGIEYPHIVMENKEEYTYFYVTVKAGIFPDIPEPLPTENYATLIKLAEEANATPVFIGVVFSDYFADENSSPICGGNYIVKITRLKKL